jgi:hypothetical protein
MNNFNISEVGCQQVSSKDIDDRPGPYCMSFGFDIEPLKRSVRRGGLINSPLLIKNRNEKLDIIIGYRRILALKSLSWDTIPCRIVSYSELSDLECLLLSFYDNLSFREFNHVEKGMVLTRLSSWIPRDEILEHYMPFLGLSSHAPTLDFFLKLDKELDEKVKESIVEGLLSLHAAKLLLEMNTDGRLSVFQLMTKLKFNVNQQKQFIEYIIDLSLKNKKTIPEIFKDVSLKNICSDTRMNDPQKAHAILGMLRSWIFPRLTHAEKTFKRMASALDLPEGVRIHYPPFFEAPNYRLEFFFKSGKELMDKVERLSRTEGLLKLRDPWETDT